MVSKAIPFTHWLKQRRKALGLTPKDLAHQTGCAEVTLRKINVSSDLHRGVQVAASLAMFAERADAAQSDFIVSDGNATAIADLCRRAE